MPPNLVYVVLTLSVILVLCPVSSIGGRWVCTPCQSDDECNAKPTSICVWGEARDACNRRICAKGPGERCGGALNILGQCGEGMMCKADEVCHGCSLQTMECYNPRMS